MRWTTSGWVTILPEFANRYRIGAEKALGVLSSSTHFRKAGSFEFQLESSVVAARLTPAQLPPESQNTLDALLQSV
jgi:hypothetical protein